MLPFNERATHRSYKKRRSFAPIFYFNCEHFLFVYIIVKQKQKNCENARKVISVYTSFVLQYTVSGRLCKHKTDVTAWHRIHLSHKKLMNYSGHRKLLCELSKLSKLNAFNLLEYLTNTDASILVYKFRPEKTGFNMYAEYTQPQLTFLALVPWFIPT